VVSDIVAGADAAFSLVKCNRVLELRTIKNRFAVETTVRVQPNFERGAFPVVGAPQLDCDTEVDQLAHLIRSSPGLTQNHVIKQCGFQRRRAIDLLHQHDGRQWRTQDGANRSLLYFPIQVIPKAAPVVSGRNHPKGGSESNSYPDSNRHESLGTSQVFPVFPPFRGGNREPLEYYGT
jgi:hypothetical protein